ncbi:MAG TPA: hypothetical protein VG650_11325 [Mycobacteriales bacterium]|nr:hypothetical protein [Mycobacteriales bacterium]
MVFRARLTRLARGTLCLLVALAVGWAIRAEIVFYGIGSTLRTVALVPTILMELALLVGLWRLWVASIVVDESGAIVRNFRGDIRLRRSEIRGVFPALDPLACHVAVRLRTGDEIRLDGLAFVTPGRAERAVRDISAALDLAPLPSPT